MNFVVVGSDESFNVNMVVFQKDFPVVYEFDPKLVAISAGFDVAILWSFGWMQSYPDVRTSSSLIGYFRWLTVVCRVVICPEGRCNVNSIFHVMGLC